jgi:hypothetical protein
VELRDGKVLKTQTFGNKDITVIDNPGAVRTAVIESKMDYAAAAARGELVDAKVIIANGVGNAHRIIKELQKTPDMPTTFYNQNDKAGAKFVHSVAAGAGIAKFDYVKYSPGEEKHDINDLVKNGIDLATRKTAGRMEDFVRENRQHLPEEAASIDRKTEEQKIQSAKQLLSELLCEKEKIRAGAETQAREKITSNLAEKEKIRGQLIEIKEILQKKIQIPEDFFTREKPVEPARKDPLSELRFDYLNPVKSPDPIRTARENVKLATGTFAAYENQIRKVNDAIKDIAESKVERAEKKEATQRLVAVREEYKKGYLEHIREHTPKVVGDLKKADKEVMNLPPEQRKEIRALNRSTAESLHAALDGAGMTLRKEFSGLARHRAVLDIEREKRGIERGFGIEKGRGL